jgi:hypothetical protein
LSSHNQGVFLAQLHSDPAIGIGGRLGFTPRLRVGFEAVVRRGAIDLCYVGGVRRFKVRLPAGVGVGAKTLALTPTDIVPDTRMR